MTIRFATISVNPVSRTSAESGRALSSCPRTSRCTEPFNVPDPAGLRAALAKATAYQSDKYILLSAPSTAASAMSGAGAKPGSATPWSRAHETRDRSWSHRRRGDRLLQEPRRCAQTPTQPVFNVQRIIAAMGSRAVLPRRVTWISTRRRCSSLDNGFFGAQRTSSRVQFGPGFPGELLLHRRHLR